MTPHFWHEAFIYTCAASGYAVGGVFAAALRTGGS
jgi:hypothetical protein